MKGSFLFFILCCFSTSIFAQDAQFTVSVSTDSILLGNYIEVSFTLENAKGSNFDIPEFEGFDVVGGPNQSSSFQMVNGTISQEISYSFYLKPRDIGTYFIPPASIETKDGFLETLPIEVMVHPNPDGIQQTPTPQQEFRSFGFPFENTPQPPTTPKKPKKKRKIYKM